QVRTRVDGGPPLNDRWLPMELQNSHIRGRKASGKRGILRNRLGTRNGNISIGSYREGNGIVTACQLGECTPRNSLKAYQSAGSHARTDSGNRGLNADVAVGRTRCELIYHLRSQQNPGSQTGWRSSIQRYRVRHIIRIEYLKRHSAISFLPQ